MTQTLSSWLIGIVSPLTAEPAAIKPTAIGGPMVRKSRRVVAFSMLGPFFPEGGLRPIIARAHVMCSTFVIMPKRNELAGRRSAKEPECHVAGSGFGVVRAVRRCKPLSPGGRFFLLAPRHVERHNPLGHDG